MEEEDRGMWRAILRWHGCSAGTESGEEAAAPLPAARTLRRWQHELLNKYFGKLD